MCRWKMGWLRRVEIKCHVGFVPRQELSDQSGGEFDNNDVRWVITVPAIWKMPAKQFMREAAYKVLWPL